MSNQKNDIENLRDEIEEIDEKLLELVGRRQSIVRQIGRAKQTDERTTRDREREERVLERARRTADELGLPPGIASRLMNLLIEYSLTAQEQDRVAASEAGDGRSVLIIGGAGGMGSWFAEFLDSQDFSVEIADPAGPVDGFRSVSDWTSVNLDGYDMILVATPIATANDILSGLAERQPASTVIDISSLKGPVHDGLMELKEAGVSVASIHPMFGPNRDLLSGQFVVFIDLGDDEALDRAKALFADTMSITIEMAPETHDETMALVLGLSHALNVIFVRALSENLDAVPDVTRIGSTTFVKQLEVARDVICENPHLYFEIQTLNEYRSRSFDALQEALESVTHIVEEGDERAFLELFEKGRACLERTLPRTSSADSASRSTWHSSAGHSADR